MVSPGMQTVGVLMACIGWFLVIVVCCLPMWKVTAFTGADITTAQINWQGIWVNCAVQSTGQIQCKVYDSVQAMPRELQAARGMIIMSIATGVCGLVSSVVGGKCTNCITEKRPKAKACVLAGVLFIISGLLCVTPVSCSAHNIITNNPVPIDSQRFELGAALYIGWAAAALLLMGGGLQCWNCPPKTEHSDYVAKFTPVKSTSTENV